MAELSARVQTAVVILCTSLYAGQHSDDTIRRAGDGLCQRLRMQLSGKRPSDRYFRHQTKLGNNIAEGGSSLIADVAAAEILMKYAQ